jgi:Phage integrase family
VPLANHLSVRMPRANPDVANGAPIALSANDSDLDLLAEHLPAELVILDTLYVRGRLGTPKSGKSRSVALSEILRELLAARRRECLERGWAAVPEFVFCSAVGGPLEERNVTRSWYRLRRKAQAKSVRPLRLHDARHTYASLALAAGKSVRWVAAQLGHASPELTLRVYAHALREEESDLSFLDFGGTKPHSRGTARRAVAAGRKPARATPRRSSRKLARREGLEPPTLRFEA